MALQDGDSWDAHMILGDQFSAAGGYSNPHIANPIKKKADAMAQRLRDAGIKHPFEMED